VILALVAAAGLFTVCKVTGAGGDYQGAGQVAVWKVTFDTVGGEPEPEPNPAAVVDGKTIDGMPELDPEKNGWTFGGWYLGDVQFDPATPVTKNITLRAKWIGAAEPGRYHITFDGDGGSPATYIRENVVDGGTVSPLPGVTRAGYTFGGWWTEKNGLGTPFTASTLISEAITLYAKWTIRQYTITFKGGDGNIIQTGDWDYNATPDYSGATPTKTATAQYTYTWDSTTPWIPAIAAATEDADYTARFTAAAIAYTITFMDEDGNIIQSDDWDYNETPSYTGAPLAKAATVQYTYTWNNTWDPAIAAVTEDTVYTARFTQTGNMVLVEGGTFTMGSPVDEAGRVAAREGPQHLVTVSSFYMGVHEVSQKEYYDTMGSWPRSESGYGVGDDFPAYYVTWYDALNYCNALSLSKGLTPAYTVDGTTVTWNRSATGYRLPTEAEWEYACRAGTITPFNTGDNITTGQANYKGTSPYNGNPAGEYRNRMTVIGSFAPNDWGLYDMHGNVWEWCWDWFGNYPSEAQNNPETAYSGIVARVLRGGSYYETGEHLRSAWRVNPAPTLVDPELGFRLVLPSE
jgi:uncharacterized repeat protein (TIGR02543 family)